MWPPAGTPARAEMTSGATGTGLSAGREPPAGIELSVRVRLSAGIELAATAAGGRLAAAAAVPAGIELSAWVGGEVAGGGMAAGIELSAGVGAAGWVMVPATGRWPARWR